MPEVESLRSPTDFRRVLKRGIRKRAGGLVMVRLPGAPGTTRIGLVVPRSAGNAVVRNRIRRRLRHSLQMVPLEPGTDYVIIANAEVAEVAHPELLGWLRRALEEGSDA